MKGKQMITSPSATSWFGMQYKKGIAYAFYILIGSFAAGLVYGLFGLIPWQTGMFALSLVCSFYVINFLVAIVAIVANALLHIVGKNQKSWYKYFSYSLAFFTLAMVYFVLLRISGLAIF